MKRDSLVKSSVTGVFCALAYVLTVVIKFDVMFLSFDLKDTILAVISLMYGPIYGVISAGIVSFAEFISISNTGVYGFLMNFIASATFAFVAGIIYKYKRDFKGAILSMLFSVISVVVVMLLANIIITPLYMGATTEEVIALIPTLLLPFNLCKAVINAAATLSIYKTIRNIMKRSGIKTDISTDVKSDHKKSFMVFAVGVILIVITVIFLVTFLDAEIKFFS